MFKAEWDCTDKMNQFEEEVMPDRSSFDIDPKDKCVRWPQFVETFDQIEVRAW